MDYRHPVPNSWYCPICLQDFDYEEDCEKHIEEDHPLPEKSSELCCHECYLYYDLDDPDCEYDADGDFCSGKCREKYMKRLNSHTGDGK